MSYTFGGATSDDITINAGSQMGGDNQQSLTFGWWYPTTLTATRGYWSAGNTFGAEVDTTTSQLRLRTDNTTDGQFTTSGGPGISVNKWWFLAFLSATENTGVLAPWRVWIGDADTPPVSLTIATATAPVGNFTGNANRYVGNKGTGTLAFQGDIGWMSQISNNQQGNANPFGIATTGVIDAAAESLTYDRWVYPAWAGRPNRGVMSMADLVNTFAIVHFPLKQGVPCAVWTTDNVTAVYQVPTINGATFTQHEPPRRPPDDWPLKALALAA